MSDFGVAGKPHVEPISVFYCEVCSLPPEYCAYGEKFIQCVTWLKDYNFDLYNELYKDPDVLESLKKFHIKNSDTASEEGCYNSTANKVKFTLNEPGSNPKVKKVTISREQRNKKKSTTIISGLKIFEIDLKKAAKLFANKFSCGSSVSITDDIIIQGDFANSVSNIIIAQWPNKITPELIEIK